MGHHGRLFIVSAPSGTGKTTVLRSVELTLSHVRFSVSSTTRPPREGEREGKDYFFLGVEDFVRRIEEGRFVEWALVHGHYYGTDRSMVERWLSGGEDVLLDVDVQGARQIRCQYDRAVTIFLLPPSWQELERRLRERGSETDEVVERRLRRAREEVQEACWYDYLVVNDQCDAAVGEICAIITASRCETTRRRAAVHRLLIS